MKPIWLNMVRYTVLAITLGLMLGEWIRGTSATSLQDIREDIIGSVLSKPFQNRFVSILVFYHVFLLWLKVSRLRQNIIRPSPFWKILGGWDWARLFLVLCTVAQFAVDHGYDANEQDRRSMLLLGIDQSTNALVFLLGIVLGQIVEVMKSWDSRFKYSFGQISLWVMMGFLSVLALLRTGDGYEFTYRGHARHSGLWVNPNTYGLLMGVGFILALSFLMRNVILFRSRNKEANNKKQSSHTRTELDSKHWLFLIWTGLGVVMALLLLTGLVRSYSRGAWLGTLAGCALLLFGKDRFSFEPSRFAIEGTVQAIDKWAWLMRNKWALAILALSIALIVTFSPFQPENRLAQRAVSMANVNDFSWRNRIAAAESALQIMWDQPLLGTGWSKVLPIFEQFYAPPQLTEPWSIILNDYFTLGMALGVPALVCFLLLILIAWRSNSPNLDGEANRPQAWWNAAFRPALVVLLIGFWFDGGLFKIALAIPFWILLELCRPSLVLMPATKPVSELEIKPAISIQPIIASEAMANGRSKVLRKVRKGFKWGFATSAVFLALTVLQVTSMKFVQPPTTGPMCVRWFNSAFLGGSESPNRYQWRRMEDLPESFVVAVWNSEDSRFFKHHGFDWIEIQLAWNEARRNGGPARGASTITQQCARSLFLWQGRSWIRKGLEAYYTVLMELLLSKKKILELYINVIEFGDGIYGLEAAAQHYYQKKAKDLTREESAMLVAIMPSPRRLNPLLPDETVLKRQSSVLKRSEKARLPSALLEARK